MVTWTMRDRLGRATRAGKMSMYRRSEAAAGDLRLALRGSGV